ncbi:hypothetical protein MMC06_000655 [Schaereria dolodes]|nr:hypothetical protein [Schaereria dolodes]
MYLWFLLYLPNLILSLPEFSNPFSLSSRHPLQKRLLVQCFGQPDNNYFTLKAINADDCFEAIKDIVQGDKPAALMEFSRTTGFKTPWRWQWGTCIIAINIVRPDGNLFMSLRELAIFVVAVVEACITDNPNAHKLGGRTAVGKNDEMHLFIVGRKAPRAEWPMVDGTTIVFGDGGVRVSGNGTEGNGNQGSSGTGSVDEETVE